MTMSGEFTFDPIEDSLELKGTLKEIFTTTEIGKTFVRDYFSPAREDELTAKLIRAARIVSGSDNVGASDLIRGLELLIDSGEAQPREVEEPAALEEPSVDDRPRDKNGKLLSPQQIAWSEYKRFAETASMDEVRRRQRIDQGFASFVLKNYQREVAQEIGDAVVPVGQGANPTSKQISGDLVNFAQAYRSEPSQNLKPKGGYVTIAGRQMLYSQFIEKVDAATAAGLL